MKTIRIATKFLTSLAFAAAVSSCATSSSDQSKEDLVIAADFRLIKPGKPDQQAILDKLPKDRITKVNYGGKTYYVLPDHADNQAYVGGPKEFAAYQQLDKAKEAALEYDQNVNNPGAGKPRKGGMDQWDGWSEEDGQTN